jgi:signal transduction histidine kinase
MDSAPKWAPRSLTISFFTLAVVIGVLLSTHRILQMERDVRRASAIDNAARYSEVLQAFRTLYTSEVVRPASDGGVPASHDYRGRTGVIPLPATMTKVLGEHLGQSDGVRIALYSAHPFPWRPPASSLDSAQLETIARLTADPDDTVVRFETGPNGAQVRYAVADRMEAECVSCHNSHPDSPKRGWVLGDVRGVLEVIHPVGAAATSLQTDLELTVQLLAGVGIAALAILALVALRHRNAAAQSQRVAEAAVAARVRIQHEMEGRIAAEDGRLAAEAQAQHAQKLESLGALAGGIAHDFNNLLVSVLGNAQLAQTKLPSSDPTQNNLRLIEQAGLKAADLTKKLLEYAGNSPAEAKLMDLNSCIDALSPLLSAAIGGKTRLAIELEQGLPPILADLTQVEQILLNLVTNAAEATPEPGGPITVRTGFSDPEDVSEDEVLGDDLSTQVHVYLEIEDEGCGLDESTRARIFDPFFSTKSSGRGLGLSTILGIVKAHRGSLLVQSRPGEGTRFRVGFPSVQTGDAPDPAAQAPVVSG